MGSSIKRKIYHVEFAKLGTGLSGGENCMLENIKHFSNMGHQNILLTTDNGKKAYVKLLGPKVKVKYVTIDSYKSEKKYGAFISYIMRLPMIKRVLDDIRVNNEDIILSHSEFLPNSFGNWLLNRKNKNAKSLVYYHMKAPKLFRGYEGEFTDIFHLPNFTLVHYILTQRLARALTSKNATILTVNNYYEEFLRKKYKTNKVVVLDSYGGIDVDKSLLESTQKDIDVVWVGRFHQQKGIKDFIEIVILLKNENPNIKIAMLGGGDQDIEQYIKSQIDKYDLSDNLELPGFVTGKQKSVYYARSRVFAMTSYYESFGQVILEAMSHGLPVVAYDLPVYGVFKTGILKIGLKSRTTFCRAITDALHEKSNYNKMMTNSYIESRKHSWFMTAKKIEDEFAQ
jgi:glycosyltransferase involved in cell wall biosynthesis